MEVHHHPHVKEKKFKEYFLEFVMIFLAVTLGFFAESVRERIVNNDKEHTYMESMVQDMKKDTAEMNQVMSLQKIFIKKMDSALQVPVERLTNISLRIHSITTLYFSIHGFIFFTEMIIRSVN